MSSFTCSCQKRALVCETSLQGQQRFVKNQNDADAQQLYEMMRSGGGLVYRHQKVLQIKSCESEEDKPEYPIELCDPKAMPAPDRDKPLPGRMKHVPIDGDESEEVIFEDFDAASTNSTKSSLNDKEPIPEKVPP